MSVIGDIALLARIVTTLEERRDKNKVRVNEAIASIQFAWTHTYDYLRNQDGKYVPNQELSNLWNEAARTTRLVSIELGEQLQDKARFWIHPELPRQPRIISLKEIQDEVARLNKKF